MDLKRNFKEDKIFMVVFWTMHKDPHSASSKEVMVLAYQLGALRNGILQI
jgi:hypothetical protein